ncbi:MAG: WS/DGAT domain-containing protein [Acidimicrobiia bacterium]|nr:WS/DGAT domain-containing protein [Acidimicrobiia bacterium]
MGRRLTNTESLMWSLGQDPNLASTMGMFGVLAAAPPVDRFETTMANLVAAVDRLRLKVNDPLGLGGTIGILEWVVDDAFDLDHHLRWCSLEGSPTVDGPELARLITTFVNDPFDRTRPLWQFMLVSGLAGGRAALLGKVHHSISDGHGMVRLGAHLLEFEPDAPAPERVDLDAVLATEVAEHERRGGDRWRAGAERMAELLQGAFRDVPTPQRLWELGGDAITSARVGDLKLDLGRSSDPAPEAAPLWSRRSRNRRFASTVESLSSIREAARAHEVSVNDLFVGACAQAAVHYHGEYDIALDHVRATVVINVPVGGGEQADPLDLGEGDNNFLPVPIEMPGHSVTAVERLAIIRAEIKAKRAMLEGRSGALSALSGLGAFVPPQVAASIVLEQAGRVDFATSNVAGLPIPAWFAGQELENMFPVGPVTGTAFNITMLSYNDICQFGIHMDPAAVTDRELLVKSIGLSFRELGVARI